jgi:EAL domain-containing protein (putative c-di-GMP-specific phosphodiesterase class I)
MRLIDEEGAIISPYSFLDISKKSKLYINLTQSIIRKSFAYFSDKNFEFSINLTVEDIMDSNLRIFLDNELERFGSYSKVIFELVESEGIECLEEVSTFIRSMKSKGCRIAIDDFGTGYSNFDYLIKLQADFIKIDGSLIKQIAHDSNSYNVVETIVQFAKKQNIKTIAEFVSDELIAQKVIELDIDYSQGYYYGAPKSETI